MNDRLQYRVWLEEDHEDSFSGDVLKRGWIHNLPDVWVNLPPSGDELHWGYDDPQEPIPIGVMCSVEQCTGEKDVNGKLAFIGDVIRVAEQNWLNNGEWIADSEPLTIELTDGFGGNIGFHAIEKDGSLWDFYGGMPESFIIIGNIHEHAHLLEA